MYRQLQCVVRLNQLNETKGIEINIIVDVWLSIVLYVSTEKIYHITCTYIYVQEHMFATSGLTVMTLNVRVIMCGALQSSLCPIVTGTPWNRAEGRRIVWKC